MDTPPPLRLPPEVQRSVVRTWLLANLRKRGRWVPLAMAVLSVVAVLQWAGAVWPGGSAPARWLLAAAHVPPLIFRGEWWRLLTWPLLHADLAHLLGNLLMFWVLGRLLEATYGGLRLWLISVAATLAAGAAMLANAQATWTVGASGVGYGWLGAWVGLGVRLWPWLDTRLRILLTALPSLVLLLATALPADGVTDAVAHAGGALGGLVAALVLRPHVVTATLASSRRWRWVGWPARAVAGATTCVTVAAVAAAWSHGGHRLALPPVAVELSTYDGMTFAAPTNLSGGSWLPATGSCRGTVTDATWALRTGRIPCWRLPYSGVLVLGPKASLFTLDAADTQAFEQARLGRRWVERQPGVLVAPVSPTLTWTVLADPALLPTYTHWLAAVAAQAQPALGGTPSQ